jgi:hypothetical protein
MLVAVALQRVGCGMNGAGYNVTEAEGFGWVSYNHPPSITGVTFTPTGLDYTVTVNATDPDASTNRDGVLEFRSSTATGFGIRRSTRTRP